MKKADLCGIFRKKILFMERPQRFQTETNMDRAVERGEIPAGDRPPFQVQNSIGNCGIFSERHALGRGIHGKVIFDGSCRRKRRGQSEDAGAEQFFAHFFHVQFLSD